MKKNLFKSVICVVLASLTAFIFAACEEPHTHVYSNDWTYDEDYHWHEPTCADTTTVSNKVSHEWDAGEITQSASETSVGVKTFTCIICGKTRTEDIPMLEHIHTHSQTLTYDEIGHWYAATCSHADEKKDYAIHDFTNGDCVCGCKDPNQQTTVTYTGKIYVVGDSTVCSFSDNYYLPRYGYGTQLYNYFNLQSQDQIVNLALSGRSSLSFLTEDNYITLKNSITEGDYLIIGFGHNDEKGDDATRYTNPNLTYTDSSTANGPSFQYTLYENYVKLADEKGATPILCTPVVRYDSKADYSDDKGHVTDYGDYPAAIRTLGAATDTTVIDLTEITKTDYIALGASAANYHAYTTYQEANSVKIPEGLDSTHLNYYGAKTVAYEIATALKTTNNTLKNYVKSELVKPTYEVDFEAGINTSYVKPDYEPFNPDTATATKLATVSGQDWYATAFGDIGGDSKVSNFVLSYSNDTFTVGNDSNNGKFSSTADGFGAAFIQVDASKNFTASATVKIASLGSSANNQAGFGMMLRDDIYVNKNSKTINSNFIAAGALCDGNAMFSRSSASALTKSGKTISVAENNTYTITITRLGQVVTSTLSDGTSTLTETYTDFDLTAIDNGYMYICLFANRGVKAEFTNVLFNITGDAIQA